MSTKNNIIQKQYQRKIMTNKPNNQKQCKTIIFPCNLLPIPKYINQTKHWQTNSDRYQNTGKQQTFRTKKQNIANLHGHPSPFISNGNPTNSNKTIIYKPNK